jgi:hypothetical protein
LYKHSAQLPAAEQPELCLLYCLHEISTTGKLVYVISRLFLFQKPALRLIFKRNIYAFERIN